MKALSRLSILSLMLCLSLTSIAGTINKVEVQKMLAKNNWQGIKANGPAVIPVLVDLYKSSEPKKRATIAWIFYKLGWKSELAKRTLMEDIHTKHKNLRLQVQWALGRVSNGDEVVNSLLDNMQNDSNPLFRDKAACALASDQIHLSGKQKARLYNGLIHALNDSKPQVRRIALQALKIQTGQTKGFLPNAPLAEREKKILVWRQWLKEYRSNL